MSAAWAQPGPGPAAARPPGLELLVLMGGIFGIFYFLVLRPEQRRRKAHEILLAGLKRNDQVTLNCGIHGRVMQLSEKTLTIEIASKVQIEVDRDAIGRVHTVPTPKDT